MERVEFEYIAYVWSKSKGKYVQLGISLSGTYEGCQKVFEIHREEWQNNMNDYDFGNWHIKYRRIVYSDWEVIHG